jgi:hypothetical protein
MVLKSIKYLYERGLLDDPQSASASYPDHMDGIQDVKARIDDGNDGMYSFENTSQPEIKSDLNYGED